MSARDRDRDPTEAESRFLDALRRWEFVRGEAKAMAEAVRRILDHRGLSISASQRRRINDCDDVDKLTRWLDQALSARSVAEAGAEQSSRQRARTTHESQ